MSRANAELAAARLALERVLADGVEARRAELVLLAGGTQRRSWLATFADGRKAVLRMPMPHSNALLDAPTEARAMDAAAAAGVAPAVIAVDAQSGVLLTEYRGGARWATADMRRPENVARVAAALRTLHALPTELPAFAAERIASRYLAALPRDVREPCAAEWGDELLLLARRYDARFSPTAFCHNDLVAANVLDDGKLVLIDFEYAVRAEPLLDLANLAAMNGLPADEQQTLLAAYRRAPPAAAELADLEWLVRMQRLMAWFWALLGHANADDSSPYAPYLTKLAADLR
jgi:thiamine kinase-like enzyme